MRTTLWRADRGSDAPLSDGTRENRALDAEHVAQRTQQGAGAGDLGDQAGGLRLGQHL